MQSFEKKRKERIVQVLRKEYMSSEEEDENEDRKKIFIKRPKSWRSEKVNKIFNSLDVYFDDKLLNKRGKDQTIIRRVGEPSASQPPENAPNWAVTNANNTNTNDISNSFEEQ